VVLSALPNLICASKPYLRFQTLSALPNLICASKPYLRFQTADKGFVLYLWFTCQTATGDVMWFTCLTINL
jgi:hypothetical protein